MPKLSDTMEEGTIVEWKKKSGEQVKAGEVLAEVESDKATFDLEAETDGVLQILVEQGVPAKIGAPIAKIGEGAGEAPAKDTPPKDAPTKEAPAAEARPQEPETTPAGRAQGADSGRTAEEREPAQKSAAPKEEARPERKPEPARADERSDGQADGQKGDDRGIRLPRLPAGSPARWASTWPRSRAPDPRAGSSRRTCWPQARRVRPPTGGAHRQSATGARAPRWRWWSRTACRRRSRAAWSRPRPRCPSSRSRSKLGSTLPSAFVNSSRTRSPARRRSP